MYIYRHKSFYLSSIPLGSKCVQTCTFIQTTLLVNYNRYSLGSHYSLFLVQWNIQESVHSWVNTNLLWWETKRTYNTLHYTREHTMMRNKENIHYTSTERTYNTLEHTIQTLEHYNINVSHYFMAWKSTVVLRFATRVFWRESVSWCIDLYGIDYPTPCC